MPCSAATCTWLGGTGNWSDPAKWSCNAMPGSTDDVVINSGTVTLDQDATVQSLTMSGGSTLTLNFNLTVSGNLDMSGTNTTINGAGNLSIAGGFTWTRGIISGSGTFTLAGALTSSSGNCTLGRTLSLTSGGSLTATTFTQTSSSTLTLPVGQTLTLSGTCTFSGDQVSTSIVNHGTIATAGTGLVLFQWSIVTNDGTINVNGSNFTCGGGPNSTTTHDGATFAIASGKQLEISGTGNTFINNSSVSGAGTLKVNGSGNTVTFSSGSTVTSIVNIAGGTLTLNAAQTIPSISIAGTLSLAANLTVTGDVTMPGGTVSGTGNLTINGNMDWSAGIDILGTGSLSLAGTLTATASGTIGRSLNLASGGSFTNFDLDIEDNAVLTVPAGQTLTVNTGTATKVFDGDGTGTFQNEGTINVSGSSAQHIRNMTFVNKGSIAITGSDWSFTTNSSSSHDGGTMSLGSGVDLYLDRPATFINNSTVSGAGVIRVSNSSAAVSLSSGSTFTSDVVITNGLLTSNVAQTFPSLTQSTGTLTLNAALTISGNMSVASGTIGGDGTLTVSGNLTWDGGTISGNGTFSLAGTLSCSSGTPTLNTRSLSLTSGGTWANNAFTFQNNATLTIPAGQTLTIDNSTARSLSGSGTLVNNGTLVKNGAGVFSVSNSTFDNNATFNLNTGTMNFSTGSVSTHDCATVTVAAGASLELGGTSHTFTGSAVSGSGNFKVTASTSTVTIATGSTLTNPVSLTNGLLILNVAQTIPTLSMTNGDLTLNASLTVSGDMTLSSLNSAVGGAGGLTINGNLTWSNGTVGGSGAFTLAGTLTSSGGSSTLDTRSLSLTSGGTWTNQSFNFLSGATMTIPGGQTLTIDNSTAHNLGANGNNGTLVNNGTLIKNGAGVFSILYNQLDNNATLNINAGQLVFGSSSASTHDNATVTIAAGVILKLGGTTHTFTNTSVSGSGSFEVALGNVTIAAGSTLVNPVTVSAAGSLTIGAAQTIPSLTMTNGSLTLNANLTVSGNVSLTGSDPQVAGSGAFAIGGNLTWNEGTIAGNGLFTLTGTMTGTNSSGQPTLDTRSLSLTSGGTWTDYSFRLQNGAVLTIPAGKTLTITNAATRNLTNGAGSNSLTNNGTLIKTGAAIFNINTPYTAGTGSITDLQQGTLDFNNTFSNSGTVKGTGTINTAGITGSPSYGTFSPGASPGTLTLTGNYTNTLLDIEIVNGTPVTFDKLVVSGSATLGGTLKVTETGAVPAGNYTILTASSISGTFSTLDIPECYSVQIVGGTIVLVKGVAKVWDGSTGTWSTASSWIPNGVPCIDDDVIINSGTCNLNTQPLMASLTINGGELQKVGATTYSIDAPTTIAAGGVLNIFEGELDVNDNFDNNGTVEGFGTLDLLGATVLGGYGTYAPGNSAGTLTVKGTYTNEEVNMEIGGTGGGGVENDLLDISQTMTLGGTFNLGYLGGTVPPGTRTLMRCNGSANCLSGTFNTVTFPPECQGNCNLEITATEVRLVNTQPIQFTGQCNWLGANSGWSNQSNWSCNDVPGSDDDVVITSGQVSLDAPAIVKTLTLSGGTLGGSGNLTVVNGFTWSGGTLSAAGNHSSSNLALSGNPNLTNGTLNLNGSGNTLTNANLTLGGNAMLKVNPGGTLTLQISTPSGITQGSGGSGTLSVQGILVKTGTGQYQVAVPFLNSGGTLNVGQGTLKFSGNFNNNGGTVKGVGILDLTGAVVQFYGNFSPGTSPGQLNLQGSYVNQNMTVEIEENGGTVAIDLLQISNTATLGNDLTITHLGGTIPFGTYPFLNCSGSANCRSGTFTEVTYPTFCQGQCAIEYAGTSAALSYQANLPVELVTFTGKYEEKQVQLLWETAAEQSHESFAVYRSSGGSIWHELGKIAGQGSSTQFHRYQFTDAAPRPGVNYYRLKMTSQAGEVEYTPVIAVEAPAEAWRPYPNPVSDKLWVDIPPGTEGRLQLFDWMGRLLLEEPVAGRPILWLDVSSLPAGVYSLRLNGGGGRVVVKRNEER